MKKNWKAYAFPLALALVLIALDLLRVNSLPAPKGTGKPIYAAASEDTRKALSLGYKRSLRGQALLGLLPGTKVYATPSEAYAGLVKDGRHEKGWGVFLLDGDIEQDSKLGTPRRLKVTRLVLMEVTGR